MSWLPFASAAVTGLQTLTSLGDKQKRYGTKSVSTLGPEQRPLLEQAVNAGLGQPSQGAFGEAANYYRSNLGSTPQDYAAAAAPQLRQYNEDIVPGLSEQFAGMGAGGLSSSGFRNAQIQGATDLSERLGALRAQLRQQSAQGLVGIGQIGLGNYTENVMKQRQPGALSSFTEGLGQGAGSALSSAVSSWASNKWGNGNQSSGSPVGAQTSPYQSATSSIPASQ